MFCLCLFFFHLAVFMVCGLVCGCVIGLEGEIKGRIAWRDTRQTQNCSRVDVESQVTCLHVTALKGKSMVKGRLRRCWMVDKGKDSLASHMRNKDKKYWRKVKVPYNLLSCDSEKGLQ